MISFCCPHCDKKYTRKESLQYHLYKAKNTCKMKNDNMFSEIPKDVDEKVFCKICKKTYHNRSNLLRHIGLKHSHLSSNERSILTSSKVIETVRKDSEVTCPLCKKSFFSEDELQSHILDQKCNIIKNKSNTHNQQIRTLNNIDSNMVALDNGTINNTTNDYSKNNMFLMNYSQIDLENMPNKLYNHCFGKGLDAVKELTRLINFNDNHPERQNISLNNIYSSYIDVFKEDDWKKADKDTFISDLYEDRADLLIEKYNDLRELDEVREVRQAKFDRFVDHYNNDDGTFKKKQKRELQLMIHNNSSKVKKTRAKRRKAINAITV